MISGNKKVRRALRKQLNRLAWLKVSDPPLPVDPLVDARWLVRYNGGQPDLTVIVDGEVVLHQSIDPDR